MIKQRDWHWHCHWTDDVWEYEVKVEYQVSHMGRAMESDAKDGVAANNDYTDCEGDREPKKTGIDDILVD